MRRSDPFVDFLSLRQSWNRQHALRISERAMHPPKCAKVVAVGILAAEVRGIIHFLGLDLIERAPAEIEPAEMG